MKTTIANLRKVTAKHGGILKSDGCGGWDILADLDGKKRWISFEVWCQPLPLNEYDANEKIELIQQAIIGCSQGTEDI